jgi:hypothetical protein
MEQSKFIIVLNKLTKNERKRYLEFIQSPYFNSHQDVKQLVSILVKKAWPELSSELVFAELYPGKPYDTRRIPDLMYKSLKLLEEFLSEEYYSGQRWERKINLLSHIRTKGIDELKSVVQAEISDLKEKNQSRDSEYHYNEFLYRSEAYKDFFNTSSLREDEHLQQKSDQLDLFYLSAKLRDSCEMLNRTRLLSVSYDFHLLDTILDAIESEYSRYSSYPAISIYYNIILMLKDPEKSIYFPELKKIIPENIRFFVKDEQRSLFGYLQNYCIRKINSGSQEFYGELLDIYKFMIDAGLMESDNINLQWDLKNMVSIALRLGEHEWTLNTINLLKPKLPDDIAQNSYTYNLANYYYETKDYKRATKLLQSVEFKEVYYSLDSKSMLLKIYFEQEEEEAFYAHVNAFNTWLNRNRLISKDTAAIYGNMVKFARKAFIFKTQLPYLRKRNQKNILALKEKIASTKQIANLNWLMREVDLVIGEK